MGGIDYNKGGKERPIANSVIARYDAGVTNHKQEGTAVLYASSDTICIDKTIFGTERKIANTITAREDRGISAHNQEGTAIGIIVNENTK